MAKGQHLTNYQRGIVNRYYEHLDTITLQKLGELVSELYLADSPKKQDQLWKRVETALKKSAAKDQQVAQILQNRDVTQLAEMITRLNRK